MHALVRSKFKYLIKAYTCQKDVYINYVTNKKKICRLNEVNKKK